ncbi:hypothetical protein HYV12_01575 [Candidatus Dojkabacteria bacterium]|nr:hypothetical protein [Candidatus Dojkabacteria bacterium]
MLDVQEKRRITDALVHLTDSHTTEPLSLGEDEEISGLKISNFRQGFESATSESITILMELIVEGGSQERQYAEEKDLQRLCGFICGLRFRGNTYLADEIWGRLNQSGALDADQDAAEASVVQIVFEEYLQEQGILAKEVCNLW